MLNIKNKIQNIKNLIFYSKAIFSKKLYKLFLAGRVMPIIDFVDNDIGKFYGITNDYLFKFIKNNLWHEKHFFELANLLIKENFNIIDLGANIGSHTVLCSKLAFKGRVFSFEPQSLTYSLLQANIINNNCNNVKTYKMAASNNTGDIISMDIFSYYGDKVNNGGLKVNIDNGMGDKAITIKIDDLVLPKIDFLKIDIQGCEYLALKGMKNIINKDRPILFLEVEEQHLKSLSSSSKKLIELVLSHNYALYRIKTNYPCDHICVPIEKIELFKDNILNCYSYEVEEIIGKEVELSFDNVSKDQNYKSLKITSK